MVSMKDIAAACSVSVATVSKALNGKADVGEEKRLYIINKAKEMGYFPNSSARALKTNRTYNIGVLFVDEARSGLTHNYFSHVLDSLKREAEDKGYDITFINSSRNQIMRMSYLEHSKSRGYDGVIIACVDFSDMEVVELLQSDLPVVTIDYIYNGRVSVMSNNTKGMQELFTYIYNQGHRRIAYIHGADSAVTRERLASFYRTAEILGVEIPNEYILESAYRDTIGAGEATAGLLDLENPPTCILYPDDYSCFGGINEIRARGLRIPEDISVAGYDGISLAKYIEPQLTTFKQDTEAIGQIAARKLISLIEKPKTTLIEQIVIEGVLCEGKTVGIISK